MAKAFRQPNRSSDLGQPSSFSQSGYPGQRNASEQTTFLGQSHDSGQPNVLHQRPTPRLPQARRLGVTSTSIPSPYQPPRGMPRPHPTPVNSPAVRRLPRRSLPGWLRLVIRLQHYSGFVAFGLIGLALLTYGNAVYTQQKWAAEYKRLESSQRSERQLNTMTELMKEKLAKQAVQPNSGMVPKNSSNQVFVPAAPARPVVPSQPIAPTADPSLEVPLGY